MKMFTKQGLTSLILLCFLTLTCFTLKAQDITFDNNGQGRVTASATSIAINSYTVPAGENRALIMFISYGGTEANITSVKFGTTDATLIASKQHSAFTTQAYYVALGTGPAVTANATATRSSNGVPFHLGLGSFKNVDQDNPIGNTNYTTIFSSSSSVSFEVAQGNLGVDYYFHTSSRNPIPGAGQTQLAHVNGGYDSNSSFKAGNGGMMTFNHNGTNNATQIHLGFELIKAISFPFGFQPTNGVGCAGDNVASYDGDMDMLSLTSDGCSGGYPYSSDAMNFVGTELCGDGYIEAYIDNVDGDGFAGVMIRESLDPGAPKVAVGTNNIDRIVKEVRALANYPSFPQEQFSLDKFWVKVERTGFFFKASVSVDGSYWLPVLQQAIMMDDCVQVGVYTRSKTAGEVVNADITNLDVVWNTDDLSLATPKTTTLGETTENSLEIGIQPNPAVDQVQVNMSNVIGQAAHIRILNLNGQLMVNRQIDQVEDATTTFDVSQLPAGTYWISVQTERSLETKKLIIQR
jgi:hypothetical protein